MTSKKTVALAKRRVSLLFSYSSRTVHFSGRRNTSTLISVAGNNFMPPLTFNLFASYANKGLDILLIPIVCLIALARILDYAPAHDKIHILVVVASLVYLARWLFLRPLYESEISLNGLDVSVVFLVVSECVLYFFSSYRANSFYFLLEILFLFLVYWLIRLNLRHEYQVAAIFLFLTVVGFCIAQVALYRWFSHYRQLKILGFEDVTDLRYTFDLLTPPRSSLAEWSTIFLALLPFPIALFIRYRTVSKVSWGFCLPVYALLLTLASTLLRGIYVATVVFFLVLLLASFYKLLPRKQVALAIGGLFAAFILTICLTPLRQPVLTASYLFNTSSQLRSAQGRVAIWQSASQMVNDYPLFGVGANNFPIKYFSYKSAEANFVVRPPNFFLHVLIEKGLIGLLALILILLGFVWTLRYGSVDSPKSRVIATLYFATLLALVVRDQTYSTLGSNKGVLLLLCFMAAHIAGIAKRGKNDPRPRSFRKPAVALILMVCVALFFIAQRRYQALQRATSYFRAFSNQTTAEQYASVNQSIDEAISLAPDNANFLAGKGHLAARVVRFAPVDFADARMVVNAENVDRIRSAIIYYRQAVALNPADGWYFNNLGWLHSYLQEQEQAIACFRKAIELDGQSTIHPISLGLLHERQHEQELAVVQYVKAVQLSPSVLDSEFFTELQRREPEMADHIIATVSSSLQEDLKKSSDPLIQAKLGKIYLFTGLIDQAIALLRQSTTQMPTLGLAWSNLGLASQLKGDETEMVSCYQKAAFLNPTDSQVLTRLAEHWYRQRKPMLAAEYYRRALNIRLNIASVHGERMPLVYIGSDPAGNDAIPLELLSFCRPKVNAVDICRKLRDVYRELGDDHLSTYFGSLGNRLDGSATRELPLTQ